MSVAAVAAVTAGCGSDDGATTTGTDVGSRPGTTLAEPVDTTTSSRPAPPPGTVEIVDFTFSPREITISRGETVTWRNEDPYAHWVVSTRPDVLDSGEMSQAQVYSKPFSQAGTYDYYCNIHNYMKATVTVR